MINSVNIGGRLTTDPVYGFSSDSNHPYAYFTIACERPYKNSNGQREADFIKIMSYDNNANYISKNFHKGDLVFITGKLQSGSYDNDDGERVFTVSVLASEVALGTKAHNRDNGSVG